MANISNFRIKRAKHHLQSGHVIAYPTQGVWGLGCDPFDEQAVYRLLTLKQRKVDKGLILIAGSFEYFEPFLYALNAKQKQSLLEAWQAKKNQAQTTFVIPDPDHVLPFWLRGQFSSIALRVTTHPTAKSLCDAFGGMLVSTSANPQGKPAAMSALDVYKYFGQDIDHVLHGKLGGVGKSSAICDLLTAKNIRQ